MSKMDLPAYLLRLENHNLSKTETLLLEIKLCIAIFKELVAIYERQYEDYLKIIKYHCKDKDSPMNLAREMIKDILSTKEYSLEGIAIYTNIPEEVLFEIASGINNNPTFEFLRKIFELHVILRRSLYDTIVEKIISDYLKKRKVEK